MHNYILVGIDPLDQPGVDSIYKFNSEDEVNNYIYKWLSNKFQYLIEERPSVRMYTITNNIINNYLMHFKKHKYIHFYDRCFKDQDSLDQYEYKWSLHCL